MWRYGIHNGWNAPFLGALTHDGPAAAVGVVYVASFDGNFYALAAATALTSPQEAQQAAPDGKSTYESVAPLWRFRTGDSVDSSPTVVDGVVYIGSGDSFFYALNEADGKMRWRYETGARITTKATVVDGVVYFGSADGYLYALDAASAEMLWRKLTGAEVYSSPAVTDGIVYVGSADGYVYALEAASGKERWRFLAGGPVLSSPTVDEGVVYVGSGA